MLLIRRLAWRGHWDRREPGQSKEARQDVLSWKSLFPNVQEALNLALWNPLGTLVRVVLIGEGGEDLREIGEEQLEITPLRDFDTKGNREMGCSNEEVRSGEFNFFEDERNYSISVY